MTDETTPTLTPDENDQGRTLFKAHRDLLRAVDSARAKLQSFVDGLDDKYDFVAKGLMYDAEKRVLRKP